MRDAALTHPPKHENVQKAWRKDRLVRMTAWMGLIVLVACAGIILVVGVGWTPMDYDEGYNLQVPEHLATTDVYATDGSLYGGRAQDFDVFISTGPTMLVPIGALFALTGPSLFVARLVPTAGYVLLLLGCWRVGNRCAGRLGEILAIEAVLGINAVADWPFSAILGTGSVLGEYTAAALVMWGALAVPTRPRVAGALIGLAALTKFLAVLALPGFVLAVIVARARRGHCPVIDAAAQLVAGCAIPLVVWQLLVFASLEPAAYVTHVQAFVRFFVQAGSGFSGLRSQGVQPRLESLSDTLPAGWLLPALLVLVALALAATAIARRGRNGPALATHAVAICYEPLLALGATSCGTLIWWLCIAQQAWIRQAMPAVIWGATVLAVCMAVVLRAWEARLSRRLRWVAPLVGLTLAVSLLVPVIARVHGVFQLPGRSLASQEHAADALRASGRQPIHLGWDQNPELMFLAHRVSVPEGNHAGLLVLPDLEKVLDPVAYARALASCGHTVRHADGYLFCVARSPTAQ